MMDLDVEKVRQEHHKFEASLAFIASIRQSELHRETVSKRKTEKEKGGKEEGRERKDGREGRDDN